MCVCVCVYVCRYIDIYTHDTKESDPTEVSITADIATEQIPCAS